MKDVFSECGKMTGKEENNKAKKCPLCGGGMHDGTTPAPFFIEDQPT